jgi:hypothetical protein
MSTLAYSLMRESKSGRSKPTTDKYSKALAALIPAEVLVLHEVAVKATTTTKTENGNTVITVTDPNTLFYSGIVLLGLVFLIHFAANVRDWKKGDLVRMFIPASAFVLWALFQTNSAIDVAFPDLRPAAKLLTASIGAAALIAIYKLVPAK